MKDKPLIGKIKYLAQIMIAIQGVIFSLMAISIFGQSYQNTWRDYGRSNTSLQLYLNNVNKETQTQLTQVLLGETGVSDSLFISKVDSVNEGGIQNTRLSVAGNPLKADNLVFFNQKIVGMSDFQKLLNSPKIGATIGVSKGTADSIKPLPTFLFNPNDYIQKMTMTFSESKNISGTYNISGFHSPAEKDKFIKIISELSGLSETFLLTPHSGIAVDNSIIFEMFILLVVLNISCLIVLFVVIFNQSTSILGKLTMLGWEKKTVFLLLFRPFFGTCLLSIPLISTVMWFLTHFYSFQLSSLGFLVISQILNGLLVSAIIIGTGLIFFNIKSLDAIKEKLPTKRLFITGILGYLLISISLVSFSIIIDSPMKNFQQNQKVLTLYNRVENFQVLHKFDSSQIENGQPTDQFTEGLYNWYKSMYENQGVYLINSQFFSNSWINNMKGGPAYKIIPNDSFWYLKTSYNYLSDLSLTLQERAKTESEEGTRVYLLPSSLVGKDKENMISWLKEEALSGANKGSIQTKFEKNPSFDFMTYNPNQEIFTWSTEVESSLYTKSPIILISTPSNMNFYEYSNLAANDLNGSIKFKDETTMKKYTSPKYLRRFSISNENFEFLPIKSYINGLQKGLLQAIGMFVLVICLMVLMLLGIFISLASIFRNANKEILTVEKILGYSFISRYSKLIILMVMFCSIEMGVVLLFHSGIGVLLIIISAILQIIIFRSYILTEENKNIIR